MNGIVSCDSANADFQWRISTEYGGAVRDCHFYWDHTAVTNCYSKLHVTVLYSVMTPA